MIDDDETSEFRWDHKYGQHVDMTISRNRYHEIDITKSISRNRCHEISITNLSEYLCIGKS